MKLEDLLTTCAGSSPEDWNAVGTWGGGAGPSYLSQFVPSVTPDGFRLQHREHSYRAAYRPNVAISVGFGLDVDSLFPEDDDGLAETAFSKAFPETSWSRHLCDFFYCGNLVERKYYAVVDGGRAALPLPGSDMTVSQADHDSFRVLDSRGGYLPDYDRMFAQSGISIR